MAEVKKKKYIISDDKKYSSQNMKISSGLNLTENEKAMESALRLLDHQDRTEAEIKKRLHQKGYDNRAIEFVTESLKDSGIINDRRYARFYAENRQNAGRGSRLIRAKLIEKGISENIIEEIFEDILSDNKETIRCIREALSLAGLSQSCEVDEYGEVSKIDETVNFKVFSKNIDDDEKDRAVILKLREKAKKSLARRLLSRGFPPPEVFDAIKKIDKL